MSGRYLTDSCRVLVLCATIFTLTQVKASEISSGGLEYIVESCDILELTAYGFEVKPLVSYSNPSFEVQEFFKDYYIVISQDPSCEATLKNLPCVSYIGPNPTVLVDADIEVPSPLGASDDSEQSAYTPNDPLFIYQWDRVLTGVDGAWLASRGVPDVVVAILDSGVDTSHVDLKENLIRGYDFLDGTYDVNDRNGHGTRVAGTIAAKIDNNEGIAGVAGNASIMPLKIVSDIGYAKRSDLVNAILYSVDNGARVISISLGFEGPEQAEKKAIEYAVNKGVIIVASAGNEGIPDTNHYPSSYPGVVSVGATTEEDERASFSDYGDGVDVYAPGKGVWQTLMGGGYGTGSGTSYAAPQVAGLAALLVSYHPDFTQSQVVDAILKGADTISTDVGHVLRMNARKATEAKSGSGVAFEVVNTPFRFQVSVIQRGCISISYDLPHSLDYTFTLFDGTGRRVVSNHELGAKNGTIKIETALSQGTYFWVFSTKDGMAKGKVIYLK